MPSQTTPRPARHPRALTAIALLGVLLLASCGSDATNEASPRDGATPTLTQVWARPAIAGGTTAVYATIIGGAEADVLTGASVDDGIAGSVELHETAHDDSAHAHDAHDDSSHGDDAHDDPAHDDGAATTGVPMWTMRAVESVPIPAGGPLELAPGGLHVMVMDLAEPLVVGDELSVTFHFEHADDVTVTATVQEG